MGLRVYLIAKVFFMVFILAICLGACKEPTSEQYSKSLSGKDSVGNPSVSPSASAIEGDANNISKPMAKTEHLQDTKPLLYRNEVTAERNEKATSLKNENVHRPAERVNSGRPGTPTQHSGYGRGVGAIDRTHCDNKPRYRSGKLTVNGSLSEHAVARFVHMHSDEIKQCYESEFEQNNELNGIIAMKFSIQPSGEVQNVKVIRSTMDNMKVENCISAAFRSWTFLIPADGKLVDVTFPMKLTTTSQSETCKTRKTKLDE